MKKGPSRRRRELLCLAASALIYSAPAVAAPDPGQLPTGHNIHFGNVTIDTGNYDMTVTQGGSHSFISWDSFSVGVDASVTFQMAGGGGFPLGELR